MSSEKHKDMRDKTRNRPFNKPNFFLLGAAKAGTTSLYHYLKSHPQVFMPEIKEPTFWSEDFQVVTNPIKYFELFDAVAEEKRVGEASHAYLSDPKVARIIATLFPESKFIIILRNPAERAYSLYNHMKRHGYESIKTFEKALLEEANRLKSEDFRRNNGQYFHNFLYFGSGLYGEQIDRYLSYFDKSQFLFLTFDELKVNEQSTVEKVWSFLEVDNDVQIDPQVFNQGFRRKSSSLARITDSRLVSNKIIAKTGLKEILEDINSEKLEPMREQTKTQLMKKYEVDQELLYDLTGIRF